MSNLNSNEFLRGQKDCRDGVEHKDGQHPDYDRGYRAEYEFGEVMAVLTGANK